MIPFFPIRPIPSGNQQPAMNTYHRIPNTVDGGKDTSRPTPNIYQVTRAVGKRITLWNTLIVRARKSREWRLES